jgi:signal transduction histidine kinase
MAGRLWLEPPRRVLTSFLVVVVACVVALAWLGYRLLEQDQALASQRAQERLESAADLAAATLERRLAALEGVLDSFPSGVTLPDGAILVTVRGPTLERHGALPLLFYPDLETPRPLPADALRQAEVAEFQDRNPLAAAHLFREAARSNAAPVRAAALVGLGRNLRKAGRTSEALDVFSELATLGSTAVAGLPAGLVAREARCSTLEESGQGDALRREAEALWRDLESGRWRLTRSAYEFRMLEARRWLGGTLPPEPSDAMAASAAVEVLVGAWRDHPQTWAGRRVEVFESEAVLTIGRTTASSVTAIVAGPRFLASLCEEAAENHRVRLALTGPDGRTIAGTLPGPAQRAAVRTAAATKLPWTLHVSEARPGAPASDVPGRRNLLLAGLLILAVLLVTSSYFVARAMTRELAVARLQSEFVASVSHEFRSPLTSIRQLSSLLVQGRLPSDDQRQRSYEFLAAETGRLERLIEGLLDFGLMEAGEVRYRLERLDAADVVRDAVAGFQRTVAAQGYRVEMALPASPCGIRGDRDALGRAIWNLLDNAVKYSPDNRTVRVDVAPEDGRLAIAVSDRGMGIPAAEQRAVFQKFVRGANSRDAGIKGTGIGLAMVRHIVAAHGGEIRLESAPREGSRFTILLPMEGHA